MAKFIIRTQAAAEDAGIPEAMIDGADPKKFTCEEATFKPLGLVITLPAREDRNKKGWLRIPWHAISSVEEWSNKPRSAGF